MYMLSLKFFYFKEGTLMKQSELLVLEIADMLERNGDKKICRVSINLLKKELLIIKTVNTI